MQKVMKKFAVLGLVVALSACSVTVAPNIPTSAPVSNGNNTATASAASQGFQLASTHWTDVAKIRSEAQRLGTQVKDGKITKVQAAQYLNRYRLNLVGSNAVDDNMYEVYQKAALDSQRGVITQEQSKAYVVSALQGWQQRWGSMTRRPANPAFTNFLMEVMGLEPLQ